MMMIKLTLAEGGGGGMRKAIYGVVPPPQQRNKERDELRTIAGLWRDNITGERKASEISFSAPNNVDLDLS